MAKQQSRSVRQRRDEHRAAQRSQRMIIALVAIGAIIAVAALVWVRQPKAAPEDVIVPESISPPAEADGKAWGPVDAPVLIEEFSDFQ